MIVEQHNILHPGLDAGWQHFDRVADRNAARFDATEIAAIVGVPTHPGAAHQLHRKTKIAINFFGLPGCFTGLQQLQQRFARIPIEFPAALDDHVTIECRDRDEIEFGKMQFLAKVDELSADRVEHITRVCDQVHLVDCQYNVADTEQRGNHGVPPRLCLQTLAGIDQNNRQVCRAGTGHHIARVLLVPRGIGDDEAALDGGEITVRHIDGDALLALGCEAIGQER